MTKKQASKKELSKKVPAEITTATTYEIQMAVLSHYLHNPVKLSKEKGQEIVTAIRAYLRRKQLGQLKIYEELSDKELLTSAATPAQNSLFEEFFNVPFLGPKSPRFTFIDLFAGIGGFRIAMQNLGGKCVYSSEFDAKAQESFLAMSVLSF